jgi:hypothetical protein
MTQDNHLKSYQDAHDRIKQVYVALLGVMFVPQSLLSHLESAEALIMKQIKDLEDRG